MTPDDIKQLSIEMIEFIWNRGELRRMADFLAADYVEHRPEGDVEGLEAFGQLVSVMREAYPDFRVELHEIMADDPFVACNYVANGTMRGELGAIKATGRPMRLEGTYLGRVEGDTIAEGWNRFDMLGVMMQLGVLSPPRAAQDLSEYLATQQSTRPA